MIPCKGAIAVCGFGRTGVIESVLPAVVREADREVEVWHGRTIWPLEFFGRPWQSRAPIVLMILKDKRAEKAAELDQKYLPAPAM